ncbi:MAG: anhydro-N-acetylmuramic acid kinase [Acidobacteriaceae bacterium]
MKTYSKTSKSPATGAKLKAQSSKLTRNQPLLPQPRKMTVAGIMSGTSADGIDVALVEIAPRSSNPLPSLKLLALESFPWPKKLRLAILAAMNADAISAAEMARLHWRLGESYADALSQTAALHPAVTIDLAGCHGQTIYHQGRSEKYLGQPLRCTWQLGEAALVAARCDVPVVSDFRPADISVGGQGAPLVPLLDYALFQHPARARILQNLGGIGNLTAIPPNAAANDLLAFDTGPANMLIDACMVRLYGKPYDRDGIAATRGIPNQSILKQLLAAPFFSAAPPKSAGREQFGAACADRFLALCDKAACSPADIIATATALTADSIQLACQRFVLPHIQSSSTKASAIDFILSGGGAKNSALTRMLSERISPLGYKLSLSDDFGVPTQAKEAMAFALLAWQTWHRMPGNIPSATGAARPAILGKVTYA